jgi:hypothetical protein
MVSASCKDCPGAEQMRTYAQCDVVPESQDLVLQQADGISLLLPADASGPYYESDDFLRGRPAWEGKRWRAHVVLGSANILEYAENGSFCSINDDTFLRGVFIGRWISRHGAFGVVSPVAHPGRFAIVSVTLEPGGLDQAVALAIIKSAMPTTLKPDG